LSFTTGGSRSTQPFPSPSAFCLVFFVRFSIVRMFHGKATQGLRELPRHPAKGLRMKARLFTFLFAVGVALRATISCSAQWTEWPVSAGGNGHLYLPVRSETFISWSEAEQLARNAGGYLATITSADENAFVFGLVDSPEYLPPGNGPLLGGYQLPGSSEPAGGWAWVTGEPWDYANWAGSGNL
jgi:hypothetical protein